MKPIDIMKVLDLAQKARKNGFTFNPLFTGDAGLGKSQICQAWVAKQKERNPNFFFKDLRIAYMEAPDMIGFPETEKDEQGIVRTCHRLPEFWPTDPDAEGLILLEEPNRGTVGIMNCLMQVLTDRVVHNYEVPKGIIFAACINPDSAEYSVNAMDAALRDRFEEYEIDYDHNSFVEYIEKAKWHEPLVSYIKSGAWLYRPTKDLGKDDTYISPRTLSKLNAAEKSELNTDRALHFVTACGILGRDHGKGYHKFCFDESPVSASDLLENKKAALKKLKLQSDPSSYKGDMINITIDSISKNYVAQEDDDLVEGKIGENTMAEVCVVIPSDQAVNLIKQCAMKGSVGDIAEYFKKFIAKRPELIGALKSHLAVSRASK